MCKAPYTSLQDPLEPFSVETDASEYAIGVVLYQEGKPIAFEIKKRDAT